MLCKEAEFDHRTILVDKSSYDMHENFVIINYTEVHVLIFKIWVNSHIMDLIERL